MMGQSIKFSVRGMEHSISNSWESLSPYEYSMLVKDILAMASGRMSVAMVRVNHVCRVMGWNPAKIKEDIAMQNLAWLAEQITFPFLLEYPDSDAALDGLSPDLRQLCKRIPPHRLRGVPIARYLARLPYRYVVDSCFCRQLVPSLLVDGESYSAYTIGTSFNYLTCSLTALQFIEARELLECTTEQLPLLAAILYCPGRYSSEAAHSLAVRFKSLPEEELQAVAFNFRSFVNYLFTRTVFSLLAAPVGARCSAISTGAVESLYNLSSDGLGDVYTIERMNVIQYLTILRKKLIETVHSLHAAHMDIVDIEKETGLPIHIIKQIL